MLALSSLPLSLCLSQPMLRTAPTYARARPAVALLTELPPGFETLMPAVVHHTPFSRHLFNAIMGYMALDTTLFAAKIIKRRMEPGVQEANRLAAAPTTKFGALPPRPVPTLPTALTPHDKRVARWSLTSLPLPPLGLLSRGSSASVTLTTTGTSHTALYIHRSRRAPRPRPSQPSPRTTRTPSDATPLSDL